MVSEAHCPLYAQFHRMTDDTNDNQDIRSNFADGTRRTDAAFQWPQAFGPCVPSSVRPNMFNPRREFGLTSAV